MHIRPKTKRRLLILFAVAAVAVGLLLVVYAFSRHRNTVALKKLRGEAMTAYRSGDYEKSVALLQDYLDKTTDPDPDAQFAFGKSRINVPLPGNKEMFEGIHAFKQYLETMKPGDPAAQFELLKLYVQASYNVEAEHLADEMLAKSPLDGQVMLWKVYALIGEHHPELALKACLKLNEIEPLNLTAQRETLALMAATNATSEQSIAHAMALHQSHENDPRFDVLLADAYAQSKDDEQRKKWLLSAAGRTPPDAQFVLAMVSSLDNAQLFNDAASFLARSADLISDPLVQRLFAQRLWQDHRLSELESRLKGQDPASHTSDGMVIGYRALALYADHKTDEAAALVGAMSRRADAPSAAWVLGLEAQFPAKPLSVTQGVTKYEQAVGRDPQNPVLRLFLAEGYLQTGEPELAIRQCNQAYQLSTSWAMPYIVGVEALLASGRNEDAVVTAQEAVKRAPGQYAARTALAKARFALVAETGATADYAALVPLLEDIQNTWHDPQTLGIYVTALARSGRNDEAAAAVKSALAATPPLPSVILTNLAQVAENEQLDIAPTVLEYAEKTHGLTPEIAYTQARTLVHEGKKEQASQLLADAARGHETELPWRIVIATFHEMTGQPDALKDWIALGDQYPEDLPLQQTILRAHSHTSDRAFWERTINRVKALTGEQALYWRIERGSWLLSGNLSEKEKAEAVNLLTQVTHAAPTLAEPHRLLALAMQKVNNIPGAIGELAAAADASPGDPVVTRALVELLIANDRTHDAQNYLDKLAHRPRLAEDVREWVVQMYVRQGANDKALALLKEGTAPKSDTVQHDLMLAELYRRVGRDEQAKKLYLALLDKPIADAGSIVEAADFFANAHDMPTAGQFMAKLDGLALKPGELEVNRAEFAERWVGLEEAFKDYQAAIAAAPASAAAWSQMAEFHLRHERFNDAAAAAQAGLKVAPDATSLRALQSVSTALGALGHDQDLQPLIEALCRNPQDPAANEMLAAMSSAHAQRLSPAQTEVKLRAVADRLPQSVLLQSQAVRACLAAGDIAAALELAQRAASAFPNNAEPQRLLANIYMKSGAWPKAEQAALLWREHSMGNPTAADVALAEIYLDQPKRDPAGAVRVLAPHVDPEAPARNPLATELYARALVMMDRSADAAALLKPLVDKQPHWRSVWLGLAAAQNNAAAAAEWISQVAGSIPSDSQKECFDLASAWYTVGVQFDSAAAIGNAGKIIEPMIAAAGDSMPQIWMLSGQVNHAKGDFSAAENAYRHVLKIDPSAADAMNNLAYVLCAAGRKEDLPEARKLAEEAIKARPGDAGFYDTLARIDATAGDRNGAVENFRLALEKNSQSLEAMIGLADLLARDPATRDQAKILVSRIQRQLDANPHLSSVLRTQFQTARDSLASSQ